MPESEKVNLLLVDDRPENLLALESILEELECTVFTATSGREALRLVLKHDFALVLLDACLGHHGSPPFTGASRSGPLLLAGAAGSAPALSLRCRPGPEKVRRRREGRRRPRGVAGPGVP